MSMDVSGIVLVAVAAAATIAGTAAFSQTDLIGIEAVDDRVTEIDRDVQNEIDRGYDPFRDGYDERRDGLSGSASLGYTGKTGETDSSEFSLGARLRYASGPLVQNIGAVLDFSESGSLKTKEDVFAIYDANYYINDRVYGFVLGRVKSDGLADTVDDVKTDGFVGFGPGYRVVNSRDLAWRVQAGIGLSYLEDGTDTSETETGYIASSRLYWRISETFFVTNDTDVLSSDSALRINNDLGLNMKMSDAFATRVGYLTEYNDSRASRSENKLGVALVYSF